MRLRQLLTGSNANIATRNPGMAMTAEYWLIVSNNVISCITVSD
jgi:hypothetical protein